MKTGFVINESSKSISGGWYINSHVQWLVEREDNRKPAMEIAWFFVKKAKYHGAGLLCAWGDVLVQVVFGFSPLRGVFKNPANFVTISVCTWSVGLIARLVGLVAGGWFSNFSWTVKHLTDKEVEEGITFLYMSVFQAQGSIVIEGEKFGKWYMTQIHSF